MDMYTCMYSIIIERSEKRDALRGKIERMSLHSYCYVTLMRSHILNYKLILVIYYICYTIKEIIAAKRYTSCPS